MQTKRGSRVATSLLLFCSSMMRRHRSRHVLRRLTSAQLVLSTTAIRSPLPPRAPRMIVTDSALNGSGGLSGGLCRQTVCRLPARQCAARCWATMRTQECAALGERRRPATTSSRWRRGRRTSMTSPKDKPLSPRFARDMREASNWRAHGAPARLSRHHHEEARASYAPRPRS